MLKDLTVIPEVRESVFEFLKEKHPDVNENEYWMYNQSDDRFHFDTGIYQSCQGSSFYGRIFSEFEGGVDRKSTYWVCYDDNANRYDDESLPDIRKKFPVEHGVADNIEQIKEYYADQIASDTQSFVLVLTPIMSDDDSFKITTDSNYIGDVLEDGDKVSDGRFGEDFQGYILKFQLLRIWGKEFEGKF